MPRGFRFWWTRPTGPTWGSTRPFPPAPWPRGADLAVASLHKMLPSLTQTALLHAGGKLVPLPQVARQTGIFQSSSPSYLLMASMDGCVRLLEEKGEALFAAWHRRLTEFDQGIQGLRHLRVLGHGREAGAHYPGIFALDPAKILISTQGTGLTGVALRDLLRREYRIEVEMALDHYVLAMTGLGTDDAMPARLAQALLAIDETCASSEETPSVLAVPGALPPPPVFLGGGRPGPGGTELPLRRHGEGVRGGHLGLSPGDSPHRPRGGDYPSTGGDGGGTLPGWGPPDRHPG